MIRAFRKEPYYLAKYHLKYTLTLLVANLGLFWFAPPTLSQLLLYLPGMLMLASTRIQMVIAGYVYLLGAGLWDVQFHPIYLLALPIAVLMAFSFCGLIHCMSHDSFRPRWLNRPIGELMGLLQLTGFADWKIIHMVHHKHADNPEWDPHPPQRMGYWEFTKGMRSSIARSFVKYYFHHFARTAKTERAIRIYSWTSRLAHWNKIAFWFLLLKPQLFTFWFATSIVAKMFQMSLVNWAAHRPSEDGVEIQNLEHSWYRVANFFSFGLYYHKNHHLAPSIFNPKNYSPSKSANTTVEDAA